jgi:hypothetical protein
VAWLGAFDSPCPRRSLVLYRSDFINDSAIIRNMEKNRATIEGLAALIDETMANKEDLNRVTVWLDSIEGR